MTHLHFMSSAAVAALVCCVRPNALADGAPQIPEYFFETWTITRDCTSQHAGPTGHLTSGSKFRVSERVSGVPSYEFEPLDNEMAAWPSSWRNIQLEYRMGAKIVRWPADFDCSSDGASTSPYVALSNFAHTAEPWYEFEHWYGLVSVHGEPHHLLIFPRGSGSSGKPDAIILLYDSDAADMIQLDHAGVSHAEH